MSSTDNYDSESEDRPRNVLDLKGDFTLADSFSEGGGPLTFKLHDFKPFMKNPQTGQLISPPFGSTLFAFRPVPSPTAIMQSCQLMGNNEHGVWTGTVFEAPRDSSDMPLVPTEVFRPRMINSTAPTPQLERFCIRRRFVPAVSGLKTMCVYTDGACLDNGSYSTTPRGGCAFVFKTGSGGEFGHALEDQGVDGQMYRHTNQRAELRAILTALTFRTWWGEGWQRVVIITDSEYVARHATGWLRQWASRGWRIGSGQPVANRDLWEELSRVMGTYAEAGCEISYWTVPRRLNTVADRVAKAAAERGGGDDEYTLTHGVLV